MVKKIFFAFICIQFSLNAQQLPNAGFENFTNDNPDNWQGYDTLLTVYMGISGTSFDSQVSPGHTGSYAIQLRSQNMGAPYNTHAALFNGTMTFAWSGVGIKYKGRPYTDLPSSYSFYYKYSPVGGDVASTNAIFTKWNTLTGIRDTLCDTTVFIYDTVSVFTQMIVPLTYTMPGNPDTLMLFFHSGGYSNIHINSTLIIDDVYMDVPVGLKGNETEQGKSIVFPNPTSDEITLQVQGNEPCDLIIYNNAGFIVGRFLVTNTTEQISLKEYSGGIYLYRILDKNKMQTDSGKITVIK
ncbi:MAG: hypothetical protein K0S33_2107 [Bacteroidetes bacterium]|jgi:hypothetical protein|nr:hypothetical protein [Bacteroidota bacterium]